VTFCTGGIRCEKAAPLMCLKGYEQVFQLDGGILNYFKKCGGQFWNGDCYVFDKRVALNPELEETGHTMCFGCRHPISQFELLQQREEAKDGKCPFCNKVLHFQDDKNDTADSISLKQHLIDENQNKYDVKLECGSNRRGSMGKSLKPERKGRNIASHQKSKKKKIRQQHAT